MSILGGAIIDIDEPNGESLSIMMDLEDDVIEGGDETIWGAAEENRIVGGALVIGGIAPQKRSASTAEPGLRQLFQIMQHARPTFAERRKEHAKKKKKRSTSPARKRRSKSSSRSVSPSRSNRSKSPSRSNRSKSPTRRKRSSRRSRKKGGEDAVYDKHSILDFIDAPDTIIDGGGRRASPPPPPPKTVVKVTDLYKYTDSLTDEPVDEFVNDYNVAVEIDRLGFKHTLTHSEARALGRPRTRRKK